LKPPDALLQQVFPAIDEWHYRLKHGDGVEHNFALEGYLRLLFFFREVILQDAAVLVEHYSHPVLNHPIFSTEEFISYKEELRTQMTTVQNPIHHEIQRVMPELCHQISVSNEALTTNIISAISQSTKTVTQTIEGRAQETDAKLTNFKTVLTSSLKHMVSALEDVPICTSNTPTSISQCPIASQDQISIEHDNTYSNQGLKDMAEQGSGKPSISLIEGKWSNKWRMGTKNQKIFSRQKIIVTLIERYSNKNQVSKNVAADKIKQHQKEKKMSLLQLADKWKIFEASLG